MKKKLKKVSVIGQGFVGLPMSIAIASARDSKGKSIFNVLGIEKNNSKGKNLKMAINNGSLPIKCNDRKIYQKFKKVKKVGNFHLSTELKDIKNSKVIIVSINFEINIKNRYPFYELKMFFNALAKLISKETLIIVETTLPPGTCDRIIYPILKSNFIKRGFNEDDILLSYSYERIMPGYNYYDSIINNYRVFSGINAKSKKNCKNFLSKVLNTKKFPLTLLNSNTECEFTKILENSYRSTNIAFIDEWTKFSQLANVDIYNVITAIKKRDTHKNIMRPGLGVGGYCLTKDPLFAITSAKKIFKGKSNFPFVELTMKTNRNMPYTSIKYIKEKIGKIKNKKILILGLSYREGIGDYRSSPSVFLYKKLKNLGGRIFADDPLIKSEEIEELNKIFKKKRKSHKYDAVIFCTPHREYNNLNLKLFSKKTAVIDLNNVLSEKNKNKLMKLKIKLFTLGKN